MYEFFSHLFDTQGWVARWVCGRWTPQLGWTYIVSSLLIGLAYFAIPFILFRFIRKRKDIVPFNGIFWLFILFIFSCGVTHFADATMFWYPAYRFSASILFITAVVSWVAVFGLFTIVPAALKFKSPMQLEEIIRQRTDDLAKKNEELLLLNEQLHAANEKTEILMHQKDEFLNIASHELKTPITSMKVTVQMLEGITENDENSATINFLACKANKQINKLTLLIEDLLDMTKIQAGKLQLEKSSIVISTALHEWIEGANFHAGTHKIIVETEEECCIEGDKNRLEQVIVNFLSNAVKYSPYADKIIVKSEKENEAVKISVTDFGIGIPQNKLPYVFDRFFRAKEDAAFSGLGLGLYISSQIIKQHGGTIGVTSEENKGSCFWFTLPLAPQPPAGVTGENKKAGVEVH